MLGVWVVNNDCGEPEFGSDTTRLAVALVSPAAEAVTVAVPGAVGVSVETALPPVGAIGEGGLKDPGTPVTENVT